jgi:predicted nucleotidyltransferase
MTTDARTALSTLVAASRSGTLDEICERLGVRILTCFGSATRSSEQPAGDLDVGVSFGRAHSKPLSGVSIECQLALWTELVELTGYENIDVVVLDLDNPVLRAEAFAGVGLFESAPGEFAETQIAALGECRDTAPLRKLSLELMAR